jgi:hypothetical protein
MKKNWKAKITWAKSKKRRNYLNKPLKSRNYLNKKKTHNLNKNWNDEFTWTKVEKDETPQTVFEKLEFLLTIISKRPIYSTKNWKIRNSFSRNLKKTAILEEIRR